MMTRVVLATVALLVLQACSNAPDDVGSPCVGAEGSPCDRRPVNESLG